LVANISPAPLEPRRKAVVVAVSPETDVYPETDADDGFYDESCCMEQSVGVFVWSKVVFFSANMEGSFCMEQSGVCFRRIWMEMGLGPARSALRRIAYDHFVKFD
jgi:hypothetical protein